MLKLFLVSLLLSWVWSESCRRSVFYPDQHIAHRNFDVPHGPKHSRSYVLCTAQNMLCAVQHSSTSGGSTSITTWRIARCSENCFWHRPEYVTIKRHNTFGSVRAVRACWSGVEWNELFLSLLLRKSTTRDFFFSSFFSFFFLSFADLFEFVSGKFLKRKRENWEGGGVGQSVRARLGLYPTGLFKLRADTHFFFVLLEKGLKSRREIASLRRAVVSSSLLLSRPDMRTLPSRPHIANIIF